MYFPSKKIVKKSLHVRSEIPLGSTVWEQFPTLSYSSPSSNQVSWFHHLGKGHLMLKKKMEGHKGKVGEIEFLLDNDCNEENDNKVVDANVDGDDNRS